MGLTLNRRDAVPPGGFKFRQAETNFTISAPSFHDLVVQVRKHRNSNNLPIGIRFLEEIEEQLCENLGPEWCQRNDPSHRARASYALDFWTVMRGTGLLLDWMVSGRSKVSAQEAEQRAHVCSTCPYNRGTSGCTSCNSNLILGLVNQIVGGDKTKYDNHLNACQVCGCALKAKVWLDKELMQKHQDKATADAFPRWCWMSDQNKDTDEIGLHRSEAGVASANG